MKMTSITRPSVSVEDFKRAMDDLQQLAAELRAQNGDGAFIHPHEIVGMATGQLVKLSKAADDTVYTEDANETRVRCLKFAYGLLFGAASLDVLTAE